MQFPAAGYLHFGDWSPWELRRSHALRGIGRRTRDQSTTRGARAQRPSARSREGIKRQGADFLSRSPVLLSPLARLSVPSCCFLIGCRQTGGPFYTADKHTVFYISQARPPERFAPGAWLSLGHTPERKPSITFLKVTLLFWNFSHMISFGIMKLHKTNRIYSYKDWECACHGKENCRSARGWNWSGSRQRKYQGIGAGRTEIWAHVPLL